MRYLLYCFVALMLDSALIAEEKWIRLQTANFEIYTPQSEKKARETALYFEQLREFFLSYWRTKAEPGTPVRIVMFGNEKQYAPFRPHEKAAGFFQHGIDRDWIVLSGYLPGWERLVCHEYTHLMVKQAGLNLPVWLNEGLAEIYSTFKPSGSKVQVGDLIPGHFYAVREGWIPLERLLDVKHDSPEYNGKGTAQFYAQAWGLTHMLMLQQQNQKVYAPVLSKLVQGVAVRDALSGSPLTVKVLEGDLQEYLKRNDRFYASLIPFKSEKSDAAWTVERIGAGEVDATLALLQVNIAAQQEAGKQRIAKLDVGQWRSQEALAYSAWRNGDIKAASGHFQEAMKLGATSAKLYYDAARAAMYSGDKTKESIGFLKKAIELYPEWTDAKLQLLEQYLFVGAYGEVIGLRAEFKKIGPKQASRLFRAGAYAEAMLSGSAMAKDSLKRAQDYAKSDYDRTECSRLAGFIASVEASEKAGERGRQALAEQMRGIRERADREEAIGFGEAEGREVDLDKPTIRRAEGRAGDLVLPGEVAVGSGIVQTEGALAFTGTLVNMECGGEKPLLRLTGEGGEVLEVEIRDPKQVNLQMVRPGEETKILDLICGEQKRRVKISYLVQVDEAGKKKRGDLRTIEYQ